MRLRPSCANWRRRGVGFVDGSSPPIAGGQRRRQPHWRCGRAAPTWCSTPIKPEAIRDAALEIEQIAPEGFLCSAPNAIPGSIDQAVARFAKGLREIAGIALVPASVALGRRTRARRTAGREKDQDRPCVGGCRQCARSRVHRPDAKRQPERRPGHEWQMPQGGIDQARPYAAALRELHEDQRALGVALIAEAPDWYSYELPAAVAKELARQLSRTDAEMVRDALHRR